MSTDSFSPELLALYYDRLFPYEEMVQWLGYDASVAKDNSTPNTLLSRREFSFTLENDQYIRYKAFHNADEMKTEMKRLMPHKIDIGAVFSVSPMDKGKVDSSKFTPVERELVFDVDLTDYDDTRTCCQSAAICHKCWQLMVAAVKVMDRGLREDFGFQHILWVYSGRRGIHCWVSDTTSRLLTNEARTAVVQYFTLVEGSEHVKRKVKLTEPLHPSLERAYSILEPMFGDVILGPSGQSVLCSQDNWTNLLDMVPDDDIRSKLDCAWSQQLDATTPVEKWDQLKAAVERAVQDKKRKNLSDERRRLLRTCIAEIVFSYLYPRLDANVSKQRNHLLKSPFAIHPKTGRVCVPIDPRRIDDFNYETVPTLASLERELNAKGRDDGKYRCFKEYVEYFAKDFIHPIHVALVKQKKAAAETTAALTGDW
ncbi:hypothetical protein H310_06586 [Aphanomyces invadans]|uniref:DNA primase n=1 Tax=Aphanomyces invadans TaxID=157072 RepID=A0A024U3G1_9STRA|nr:hypothetical protein H310_06586 [Aphanomyces invadans]ETW00931.1 hypothetical protein H310_06586 [Aphanomyces invadans]|eukprot:XP_008869929.1 hypothetical protein H310_06586 [Aphanomyces invadans]